MGIGSKLDKLIKTRGTNANDLAQKVDVPASTIYSLIARDSKKVDIDVLLKISKELGVTAEYFCNDDMGEPTTIAAHLDTDELTQDELDDVAQYIEFIKNKRK